MRQIHIVETEITLTLVFESKIKHSFINQNHSTLLEVKWTHACLKLNTHLLWKVNPHLQEYKMEMNLLNIELLIS